MVPPNPCQLHEKRITLLPRLHARLTDAANLMREAPLAYHRSNLSLIISAAATGWPRCNCLSSGSAREQ